MRRANSLACKLLMGLLSVVLDTLFPAPGPSSSTVFGRASSDLARDWPEANLAQGSCGIKDAGAAIVFPRVAPALWLQAITLFVLQIDGWLLLDAEMQAVFVHLDGEIREQILPPLFG